MLKALSEKLRESVEKIARLGVVDKEAVDNLVVDMQRALLSTDVDVELVFNLSESIKNKALQEKLPTGLTRKEHILKVVYEELTNILGKETPDIQLKPKKILLVGLFGSGKTSTSAKLARFYQKKGLKPALVCCDVARPAAYEQLQQLAAKIDAAFYGEKGSEPQQVLRNALDKIQADVLIVDSSGRNALDDGLIGEIKSISAILNPQERILVIPADIGQAAKEQANAFHKALGITDVIITKLDATARGGGALTACYESGAKVAFITTGETAEDIEIYDPHKFVGRLIGFPDIETLMEKARNVMDEKKAEKIIKGDFDLDDFYSQVEGMQKMGPLAGVLDMIGMGKIASKVPGGLEIQEQKMKKWKYALQSMTRGEKANPSTISSSRISRIAKGSGCTESDVRELLSHYNKVKKPMKTISPAKLKRSGMAGVFRKFMK